MRTASVLVVLLILLQHYCIYGGDENLFTSLFDTINTLVTPKFEGVKAYTTPSEIFLMQLPGQTINPDDFDAETWKANGFQESDPDYNSFLLTDSIPVPSLPYYVDSGKKMSNMYKRFLENYITVNARKQTEEQMEIYKQSLKKVMTDDYAPSPLAVYTNETRIVSRNDYANMVSSRDKCLYTTNPGVCALKAKYSMESTQDNHMQYLVTQKELLSAQAKVLSLQFRSFDLILMQAYSSFLAASRSCVGAKSFLGDYMQVRYEPADFYKWWKQNTTASSFKTAFTRASVFSDSKTSVSSDAFSRSGWGGSWSYQASFFSGSGSWSGYSSTQSFSASEGGSSTSLSFDLASVKVNRAWFDASLFDLSPLGIKGTPKNYWSDGNFKGTFPWFISKMIVAKNVKITKSSWNSQLQSTLQQASNGYNFQFSAGPFQMNANYNDESSDRKAASSFKMNGNSLELAGPQIIGFVMAKIVAFPNYDDGDFNVKVL